MKDFCGNDVIVRDIDGNEVEMIEVILSCISEDEFTYHFNWNFIHHIKRETALRPHGNDEWIQQLTRTSYCNLDHLRYTPFFIQCCKDFGVTNVLENGKIRVVNVPLFLMPSIKIVNVRGYETIKFSAKKHWRYLCELDMTPEQLVAKYKHFMIYASKVYLF